MTSRERVLKALNHEEPDRVPLDLGASRVSGIAVSAYAKLKKHLNLDPSPPKVYDVFQMLAEVEQSVVDRLQLDAVRLGCLRVAFDLRNEDWKPWTLFDGTEVLVPGDFAPVADANGDLCLYPLGDTTRPPLAKMPRDGFYFDTTGTTRPSADLQLLPADEFRQSLQPFTDEELELIQQDSIRLRQTTDCAVVGEFWKSGLGLPGSFGDQMLLLAVEKEYVRELFGLQVEFALGQLEAYRQAVEDRVDVLIMSGHDYGTQKGEFFNPETFAELHAPHYKQSNDWVHKHTDWKTLYHTCGSVYHLIPHLIDAGMDILNPVQCSAAGMEADRLKREFGHRITFWGGGVNTQKTLPFGTPDEVCAEVRERLRTFGPGGGFVLNPVHNVQHGTPPENLVAMCETVVEQGRYPL